MANALYPLAKKAILDGEIDFLDDTIKLAILDGASYNAAHQYYDDVSASALGTPQTLTSKSTTGGTFDAADPTFTAVASGDEVTAYVIYKDTGNPASSPLIAWFDTDDNEQAISVPTNGGDITVVLNASGIFSI